jgi:hypothetical protein
MKRVDLPGCIIAQRGGALQVAVAGPIPVLLEFSGESLVSLLMAAQAAFRERKQPESRSRGGRTTALVKKSWRVA